MPPADDQDIDQENLDEALQTLEGLLQHRQVVPEPSLQPEPLSADDGVPPPQDFVLEPDALPVLDDVVVQGKANAEAPPEVAADGALPQHYDLMTRLVSEMTVIIESSVDDVLKEAKQEVTARLKNHLDIVLPEIVDELLRRCSESRHDDEPDAEDTLLR